jgi:hypothetical protein
VVLVVVVVVPTVVQEHRVKVTEAVIRLALAEVTTLTPGVLLAVAVLVAKVLTEATTLVAVQVVRELLQVLLAPQ